ncbi:glycosyltransferase family 2 protein [Butyrivibrio fibrisolvens]|uniref:glycosyltransferase family 2 protein n=1 Tax=Pseudobutyrivibrio ruminis TaxID=46206 RepID=UPI0003FDB14C|nr:glycosyltransferase family 2 protein [Pseudobutyrivibrio ruminis]MDC7278813.1 glycosyltransferase family 2 protein [Butyrivibrio fibrisolvens]
MLISIVITTYNSFDTIIDTLESIKYQINHFAVNDEFQLIIGDDGSTDGTQDIIKFYIKENESLFRNVELLFSEINRGTCKNSTGALREVKGERFIFISGDDLLSKTDVITRVKELKTNEIVMCPPLKFQGTHLIRDYRSYIWDMISSFRSKEQIKERAWFSCPIMNGSLIGTDFYNEDIYSFIDEYNLLEDRAHYVRLCEKYDFVLRILREPLILYRQSDNQVTKAKGHTQQLIKDDIVKISKYALNCVSKPYIRIRIYIECFKACRPSIYSKIKYLLYIFFLEDIFQYFMYKKEINKMTSNMFERADNDNIDGYIEMLHDCAERYYFQYNND